MLLALGALFSAAVRGVQTVNFEQTHTPVGPYFLGFFFRTYMSGARRRALVGSILKACFHHPLSPSSLSLFSIAILAGITFFILHALRLKGHQVLFRNRLAQLVLLSGVVVAIQWEVVGDLLQIDLLLFFFLFYFLRRYVRNASVRSFFGCLILLPLALVHEAAIFIVLPFVPYLSKRNPERKDYVMPVLFALALLGGSVVWGKSEMPAPASRTSVQAGRAMVEPASTDTPPFGTLMMEELAHDFGSARLVASFVSRLTRICILFFTAQILLCWVVPTYFVSQSLHIFRRAMLLTLPLWLIAHDWGRFLSYTLILSLVVALALGRSTERNGRAYGVGMQEASHMPFVQIAAVAVSLLGPGFEARVSGMDLRGFLSSLPFVLMAGWQYFKKAGVEGMFVDLRDLE